MVKQNHKWDPSSSHLPGRGGGEENAELLLLTRESTNYWKIPLVVIKYEDGHGPNARYF